MMVPCNDEHIDRVEPICAQLTIAPSTYDAYKARAANVALLPARAQSTKGQPAADSVTFA
jgi:hypothetical protein